MKPRTKQEFEKQLQAVIRRAKRLQAAIDGSADVKRVHVDGCKVEAHTRGEHYRTVITLRRDVRPKLRLIRGGRS